MIIAPGSTLLCHTYQSYTISAFHSIWPPTRRLIINVYLHLHSWCLGCGTKTPASLIQYISVPSPLAHHSVLAHLHHPDLHEILYCLVWLLFSDYLTSNIRAWYFDTSPFIHPASPYSIRHLDLWNFKCVVINSAAESCFNGNNQ